MGHSPRHTGFPVMGHPQNGWLGVLFAISRTEKVNPSFPWCSSVLFTCHLLGIHKEHSGQVGSSLFSVKLRSRSRPSALRVLIIRLRVAVGGSVGAGKVGLRVSCVVVWMWWDLTEASLCVAGPFQALQLVALLRVCALFGSPNEKCAWPRSPRRGDRSEPGCAGQPRPNFVCRRRVGPESFPSSFGYGGNRTARQPCFSGWPVCSMQAWLVLSALPRERWDRMFVGCLHGT